MKSRSSSQRLDKYPLDMNVLFVTYGDESMASSRYRVYNLLPHLEDMGINTSVITAGGKNLSSKIESVIEILYKSNLYDVVYIQKVLLPMPFLSVLNSINSQIVYDFDDALYTSPPESNMPKARTDRLDTVLEVASAIVAGSPTLADYTNQHSDEVYCLPTSVPKSEYPEKMDRYFDHRDDSHIGWIGNPENLVYLESISDPLVDILDNYSSTELLIITSKNPPITPLKDRDDVSYLEWSQEDELKYLSKADISIRPLSNDEWTRAKGGFTSVVQCLALHLPVVVSPVGMIPDIIDHGETGYLADSEQEWKNYLSKLIEDRHLIKQMGEKGYNSLTKKRFWTEQRAEDLASVLNAVLNRC